MVETINTTKYTIENDFTKKKKRKKEKKHKQMTCTYLKQTN